RGLHIRARQRQHCISVRRSCEGLLVDSVSLTQPPTSSSGSLVLWTGASGSEERPIVLGNLDVHCGEIGIVIVGTSALPAALVRFANYLILQCDQILLAGQDLAPVAPRWLHNNWWEANAATNETQARLVADVKEEVLLLSREPKNANFLRPAAGTMKGAVQDGA